LMINCVLGSMVPLMWVSILLFGILMVFALIFMQGATQFLIENPLGNEMHRDKMIRYFGNIQDSMMTLLMGVTGGEDWGHIFEVLKPAGQLYAAAFVFFVVFFLLSFFNITTSLFVDQALKLSRPDNDVRLMQKWREDMAVANDLKLTIASLDENENGLVTRDEWLRMSELKEVRTYFEIADLEIKDANEFFDAVANMTGSDEVDVDSFVEGCMKVKGAATSVDQQVLLFQIRDIKTMLEELGMHAPEHHGTNFAHAAGMHPVAHAAGMHPVGMRPGAGQAPIDTGRDVGLAQTPGLESHES